MGKRESSSDNESNELAGIFKKAFEEQEQKYLLSTRLNIIGWAQSDEQAHTILIQQLEEYDAEILKRIILDQMKRESVRRLLESRRI